MNKDEIIIRFRRHSGKARRIGLTAAEVHRHLERIAKANDGQLTPEAVVEEARNPRHPLHDWFEWDDSAAAHQHRLWQARQLIRIVQFEIKDKERTIIAPAYLNVRRVEPMQSGGNGSSRSYVALPSLAQRRDDLRMALYDLMRKVDSMMATVDGARLAAQKIDAEAGEALADAAGSFERAKRSIEAALNKLRQYTLD